MRAGLVAVVLAGVLLVFPTLAGVVYAQDETPPPPPAAAPQEDTRGLLGGLLDDARQAALSELESWWTTTGPPMVYRLIAKGIGVAARETVGGDAALAWSGSLLTFAPERTYAAPATQATSRLVDGLVGAGLGVVITFAGFGVMWSGLMGTVTDAAAIVPRAVLCALVVKQAPRFLQWLTDTFSAVTLYLAGASSGGLPGADAVRTAAQAGTDDVTVGTLFLVYGIAGMFLKLGRMFGEALWSFLIVAFALAMVAWVLRSTFVWFGRWLTLAAGVLVGGALQAIPLRQGGDQLAHALTTSNIGESVNALLAGIASLVLAFFLPAMVGVSLSGPGLRTLRRAAMTAARAIPATRPMATAAGAAGSVTQGVAGRAAAHAVINPPGSFTITRMPLLPAPRAALPPPR